MNEQALSNALAFAEWGFPIVSVWRPDTGVCRCVKGKSCRTPGKHPIPHEGFKAATTDEARIRTMLSAAGSEGQYGLRAAPHTILIDADGEGFAERVKELGLTDTLIVQSGSGLHLYFYWPDSYGPVPTHLFGWKVRSSDHEGIVIGPGSTHANGKSYRIHRQNGHDVHQMLATIKNFPKELVPPDGTLKLVVSEGVKLPETILEGSRHDFLRDRARTLRGGGLTGDDLFNAVSALNRRLPQPKTDEDIRRAIGDVETKFGEDPVPLTPEEAVAAATNLIVSQADYHAANSAVPEWVSPLAAYGSTAMVSGPPKAGKSTFISGLMRAREDGTVFLWGDPVPKGPMLLVTEEGGFPVVRKTVGLDSLFILDRMAFVMAGLKNLDHLLAALSAWVQPLESRALVIIDTLAVWGDIKDENDSMLATKAIVALKVWAQVTMSAVVLVHHTRKGGGEHGEAIRGGSGIFAAVDLSAELGFGLDPKSDNRTLTTVGRIDFGESKRLAFDRDTQTYSLDMAPPPDSLDLDQFPEDGYGHDGLTREEAQKLWGVGQASANAKLKELVDAGRLVTKAVRLDGERVTRKVYWRPRPLLDVRSVGERMADIIGGTDERE